MIVVFLSSMIYSYWCLKDYVFWLSWSGQTIKAIDIITNWLVYWLQKAIFVLLPPGVGYFAGLVVSGFDSQNW